MAGSGNSRNTRAKRNPFYSNLIAGATFATPTTETSEARTQSVQLTRHTGRDVNQRGRVRAWIASDSSGTPCPQLHLPTAVAAGADGKLLPTGYNPARLIAKGTLAVSAVAAEKFKTTATAGFHVNGGYYTKAATDNLTFSAAHVVTASKFAVILIQINAAGTVSTKVPGSPQAYNTAALALAALPEPDAGNVALGYIAIAAKAATWTANTDDLTNGSDLTTAAFVDANENAGTPAEFSLTSEADGDIDVAITDAKVRTHYLAVELPDGSIAVSGAIAFA